MATITTTTTPTVWSPDLLTFEPQQVIPDALVLTTSTVAGNVEGDSPVVRVGYVDLDADEVAFVGEAQPIPETDPELSEALVATGKLAVLVKLSREQAQQTPTMETLSRSLGRAMTIRGNRAYLTQPAPTAPALNPAPGLLNVPGLVNGGELAGDLDALTDMLASLEANDAAPSHILIDPQGWAALDKLKAGTGSNMGLLGTPGDATGRTLKGLPVTVTTALPARTGMIIDKTAVVSAAGPVQVQFSDQVFFQNDAIAARATWRFGQTVIRPERVGKFTIAA